MRIISFIDQHEITKKILEHMGLWKEAHAPLDTDPVRKEMTPGRIIQTVDLGARMIAPAEANFELKTNHSNLT